MVRLHGLPLRIVSDRDTEFTSLLSIALFKSLGPTLNISTLYHPQIDGQAERMNQIVEDLPRSYCFKEPK